MIALHGTSGVTFVNRANDTEASVQDFDVAVVGGGISGVYAAWRRLINSEGSSPHSPRDDPTRTSAWRCLNAVTESAVGCFP
jgi:hypothetical protein